MTIRTRLIFNYTGIVLVILLGISVYLNHFLKQVLDRRITTELRMQAELTREFLAEAIPEAFDYDAIDALVDKLGAVSAARLTFVGLDGIVWGDTERDGEELRGMDNHRNRPEIQAALSSGYGIADRYSNTLNTSLRYFALPVYRRGEMLGIGRVALPMKEVKTAIARFRRVLWLAIGIGFVGGILLSVVTAGRIAKPIRKLTQTTRAIAEGDITSRVEVVSSDELGQLSYDFNQMADRIEAQIDEISQERNRMDTILSGMVEGVLLVGEAFDITYANPAAIQMLDLPSNYQGQTLMELHRNVDLQHLLEQARDTGTVGMTEILLPTGIAERDAEVTVVPVTDPTNGGTHCHVLVLHDVSQLRKLEQIRVDFIANVSHELRTPLTSIQGYAETLLDGALTDAETSQHFVAKIMQQASQLSQLVSDLLDLSRLESGTVQLNLEPCRIKDFRTAIWDLFEPVFEGVNLAFEWEVPEDLPAVLADKHLLEQVFVNLIDNATKYTPADGRITVSADARASEVVVHVADTGIGIPSDALPRIFERFYRVDKARSRKMGGTGLGLSIAKHIVLQHGGQIWVESEFGKGTVFHFSVPQVPHPECFIVGGEHNNHAEKHPTIQPPSGATWTDGNVSS